MNLAFKRIVVATDFSRASELAVQYARTLALRFGASMHLVHVVEEPFPISPELYIHEIPDFRERLVTEARRQLGVSVAEVPDIAVTSEVLIGTVARRIVEAAATSDADLIVMGTHGRGALGHFLVGSVAERVVRTAGCPVLTVRDPQAGTAGAGQG
jgi:nucleotide-binding universal stress UspA family protein